MCYDVLQASGGNKDRLSHTESPDDLSTALLSQEQ